jgi:hypothetical protein
MLRNGTISHSETISKYPLLVSRMYHLTEYGDTTSHSTVVWHIASHNRNISNSTVFHFPIIFIHTSPWYHAFHPVSFFLSFLPVIYIFINLSSLFSRCNLFISLSFYLSVFLSPYLSIPPPPRAEHVSRIYFTLWLSCTAAWKKGPAGFPFHLLEDGGRGGMNG